ncbi:MAG: hemolysin family protein [Lachnospiraceae bacterium]|nr:hemolysin family protein [Lachnospiraceae bacterium]MDY3223697.1 hemolysin family protein [Lachnospiraceae bacterium]
MDTTGVIQVVILFILLFLSGFFSSAETALSTVNRVKIRSLIEEGNKRAATVEAILDNYGKMISAILIGNNIVNISASALATTLAIKINLAVGVATGILTLLVLLFGEIFPKTLAKVHSQKLALAYAPVIKALMVVLTPVIYLIDLFSNSILRLLKLDPNAKPTMTETELKTYVDVSHEDGVIESEEREMIYNVFDFSDAVAKDIMIPRIDMVTVDINSGYEDLLSLFREYMYTRIPVYEEDKDNIIGQVNIKDFILVENKESFSIRSILRDAHYTYEYKKTADLMMELRQQMQNVAFVLNEYGACVGMITMEDLLEEIVGEIRDEYDAEEEEYIQEIEPGTYLVEGSMKLDDINDALGTKLDSEDYDSIAGIVIEILDRMPEDGDEVTTSDGIHIQVKSVSQNRITKVLLTLPPSVTNEGSGEEAPTEASREAVGEGSH